MPQDLQPLKDALVVKGTDPKSAWFTIIEIPLSGPPDQTWVDCFNNPASWSPSVHKSVVRGDRIIVRANSGRIEEDLKWVYSYIDQANAAYRPLMDRMAMEKNRQQELTEEKERELRLLTEKLRRM
jgi:hypothetical protein